MDVSSLVRIAEDQANKLIPMRRDKKNATTYQLFHRSQNDPLIHDASADDRVLYQVSGPTVEPESESSSSRKHANARNLSDLEREFGSEAIRTNEGEAANYGIFYDDTEYDYMQHLRELGMGESSHFVEAPDASSGKGKNKGMKLEDALRQVDLSDDTVSGERGRRGGSTTTSYVRKPTYQDQQDIPDAIAGFQPDMDPRLREVLEALDDDAYVDDEDEGNVFGKLTVHAEEMQPGEWEDSLYDYDDDNGWESDVTEKAPNAKKSEDEHTEKDAAISAPRETPATDMEKGNLPDENERIPDLEPERQEWMHEFAKFKKDSKADKANIRATSGGKTPSVAQQTVASTVFTAGGTSIRHKKRKGAQTNPSAYSMSSSALARTEGHRLLDDRFDRLEALYALDEEGEEDDEDFDGNMSIASGMTGLSSRAPSLVSADGSKAGGLRAESDGGVSLLNANGGGFSQIMDDFLDQWDDNTSAQAKRKGAKAKRGKNGNEAIGMRMLDEIRSGLGPGKPSTRRYPGKV